MTDEIVIQPWLGHHSLVSEIVLRHENYEDSNEAEERIYNLSHLSHPVFYKTLLVKVN
jgi:hypothetical protein